MKSQLRIGVLELQKFLDLIPLDQIVEVTKSYYVQDNEFRKDEQS